MTLAADAKTSEQIEYEIKAAFVFNFMRCIDWTEQKTTADYHYQKENATGADAEKPPPMISGIVGKNPFGEAFKPVQDRTVNERPVKLVLLDGLESYLNAAKTEADALEAYRKKNIALLSRCHILFLCISENEHLERLLLLAAGSGAVTISDIPDFVLRGGMIGFVMDSKRVRFDINLDNVEKEKLNIRSQLLELARRIHKKPKAKD